MVCFFFFSSRRRHTRLQGDWSSDVCSSDLRRLDALGGLTVEDRLTVNRVKQLHAAIQTEYSIAHALRDLGRDQEAAARAAVVRPQAAELTRLVREIGRAHVLNPVTL